MTQQELNKILKELNKKATEMSNAVEQLLNNGEEAQAIEIANQVKGLYIAFDIINAMGK